MAAVQVAQLLAEVQAVHVPAELVKKYPFEHAVQDVAPEAEHAEHPVEQVVHVPALLV
jgi:hypothetical protein